MFGNSELQYSCNRNFKCKGKNKRKYALLIVQLISEFNHVEDFSTSTAVYVVTKQMCFSCIYVFKTAGSQDIIQGYTSFQRTAASWKCSLRNTTASATHTDINLQSVYKIEKYFTAVARITARSLFWGILRDSLGCIFLIE